MLQKLKEFFKPTAKIPICPIHQKPQRKVDYICTNCGAIGIAFACKPQDIVYGRCQNCGCETLTLN